eukprot:gnl/Chilomastix_caulleri/4805.p2 GENE.gnl/Chilomastix_caulleri/4805~~gnl/Chilomastix_caulleri/4805.p2  ORF type:complete len:153 (+),score=25.95 gnl/Chilomastix_caulleri/4805:102-560(+)
MAEQRGPGPSADQEVRALIGELEGPLRAAIGADLPPVSEKLLSRPPFKYLFDVLAAIKRNTGFPSDGRFDTFSNREHCWQGGEDRVSPIYQGCAGGFNRHIHRHQPGCCHSRRGSAQDIDTPPGVCGRSTALQGCWGTIKRSHPKPDTVGRC